MSEGSTEPGVLGFVLDLVGGSLVTVVYGSVLVALLLWGVAAGLGVVGAWGVGALAVSMGGGQDYGALLYVAAMTMGGGLSVLMAMAAAATHGVGVMGAVGAQVSREAIGGMGRAGAALHVLFGLVGLGGWAAAGAFGYVLGAQSG